jgi:hypothetical protein
VQEILDMIYIIEYVKIFDEWKVWVRQCIDSGGEYI